MQKILIFTDIHLTDAGNTIINLDPMQRFQQGLEHAIANHSDATRVILTGDLTHHGKTTQFQRLKTALSDCPIPVSLMLGNHDSRKGFNNVFPDEPRTSEGFVQQVIDMDDYRLILMDTLDEPAENLHSGYLCEHRLAWLDQALSNATDRKVIVFTHHPPMLTGFDGMDDIALRNRSDLIERLKSHPKPVQVISGHIHRTISGQVDGIPVSIFKSPCHQMPMCLGPANVHSSVDEPGAYGLILLHTEGPIIHTEDFSVTGSLSIDTHEKEPS
jgi:3',5'-cyclic AMP phosphodiesterase CpdA